MVDSNSSIDSGIMVSCKVNADANNHTHKSKEVALEYDNSFEVLASSSLCGSC